MPHPYGQCRDYLASWCLNLRYREYSFFLFPGGTVRLLDEEGYLSTLPKEALRTELRGFVGDEAAARQSWIRRQDFIISFVVDESFAAEWLQAQLLLEEGASIPPDDKDEIDARMMFYFWRHVNPFLIKSLY